MISISCTNCKTVLSIDDAFAGGVCRCQHCGTIQTVPAQNRRDTATVAAGGQSVGASKSLYQADGRTGSGSGLDELAGVVVSSGLSSRRLTRPGGLVEALSFKQNSMAFIIAGTVIVALLLVIIVILLTRNPTVAPQTSGATGNTQAGTGTSAAPTAGTPSFCGTPLTGNTVIYLLDCGTATSEYLGDLKDATIKSVGSLGADRKFQILFWNNGTTGAYPENTTTYASTENIASAQKTIEDVAAFGQSDVKAALQLAVAQHPDVIVLATGKGWDLDNAWLDSVMTIRSSSPVKINAYNLGVNGESAPLKKLASQTGGSYHELSQPELRAFGR